MQRRLSPPSGSGPRPGPPRAPCSPRVSSPASSGAAPSAGGGGRHDRRPDRAEGRRCRGPRLVRGLRGAAEVVRRGSACRTSARGGSAGRRSTAAGPSPWPRRIARSVAGFADQVRGGRQQRHGHQRPRRAGSTSPTSPRPTGDWSCGSGRPPGRRRRPGRSPSPPLPDRAPGAVDGAGVPPGRRPRAGPRHRGRRLGLPRPGGGLRLAGTVGRRHAYTPDRGRPLLSWRSRDRESPASRRRPRGGARVRRRHRARGRERRLPGARLPGAQPGPDSQ